MTIEFRSWPKIPRLSNETYFITENIDGTNAADITVDVYIIPQLSNKVNKDYHETFYILNFNL